MKFTCTQENLQRGLSIVNHLAGKNTTLPILNNVLIKAENGSLELSTTNLEVGVKCLVRGKIESEGSFTVQARLLSDYVNLLPSEPVSLELNDAELEVKCESYKTKVKGMSSEDFPLIASVDAKQSIQMPVPDFKEALSQVIFSVAMDETRPEISGVFFQLSKDGLTLASTDSFRLAEKILPLKHELEDESFIVPYRTLQELNRILSDAGEEEPLTIRWTENQVSFEFDGIELISRLIEGQYPDYRQIVPTNFKTEFVVDAKELVQLVKSASLFCRAGINDVHFIANADSSTLEIKAANSQLGENKGSIGAEITGDTNEIVFNYRYILDGLANMKEKKVRLKLIDKHNPGLFLPEGQTGYTYIIMPIKS
jgi:DNA polymerase III subunit beta